MGEVRLNHYLCSPAMAKLSVCANKRPSKFLFAKCTGRRLIEISIWVCTEICKNARGSNTFLCSRVLWLMRCVSRFHATLCVCFAYRSLYWNYFITQKGAMPVTKFLIPLLLCYKISSVLTKVGSKANTLVAVALLKIVYCPSLKKLKMTLLRNSAVSKSKSNRYCLCTVQFTGAP